MISVIIPVYNRPHEIDELLASLACQKFTGFEVVVVEDGSRKKSREIVDKYQDKLTLSYYYKDNGGPGIARNFGAQHANGDFFVFLDSDCVVPTEYMEVVHNAVENEGVLFFGGPDTANESFTPMQKAVNYSMTSFFTTGGIRGSRKRKLDRFIPRSFNMGIRKDVFFEVGGFCPMRFGEDVDLSMRIIKSGVQPELLSDAAVFHKRRINMESFFRQVYFSGVARINLCKRHPHSLRFVHILPTLFTIISLGCIVCAQFHPAFLLPLLLVMIVWFTDSSIRNHSVKVGWLSIWTSFVEIYGYGAGFIVGIWKRYVLRKTESDTFKTDFS